MSGTGLGAAKRAIIQPVVGEYGGIVERLWATGVVMWWGGSDDIPRAAATTGMEIGWYREGDIGTWIRIHQEADPVQASRELYEKVFGTDEKLLKERQCFVRTKDGNGIATATAWFDGEPGNGPGVVHFVAVTPEFQGRGLSKVVVTSVLRRLRELGHRRIYLMTDAAKLPAINLYLRLGFLPWAYDDESEATWLGLAASLKPEFGEKIKKTVAKREIPGAGGKE